MKKIEPRKKQSSEAAEAAQQGGDREMATYRFIFAEKIPGHPELVLQYYPEVEQINLFDLYNTPTATAQRQGMPAPHLLRVVPDSAKRLRTIRDSDQSNITCIDCKANLADHASLTYGVYLCGECAELHQQISGPRGSYIKSLFKNSDIASAQGWDEYSLRLMEQGGNYQFRKFMSYYKLRCKEMQKRYCHKAAQYYGKQLRAKVEGTVLPMKPPTRNYTFEESSYFISRGVDPANFFPPADDDDESDDDEDESEEVDERIMDEELAAADGTTDELLGGSSSSNPQRIVNSSIIVTKYPEGSMNCQLQNNGGIPFGESPKGGSILKQQWGGTHGVTPIHTASSVSTQNTSQNQ